MQADVVGHGALVPQARNRHLVDVGFQAIFRPGPLRQDRLEGIQNLRGGRNENELAQSRAELGNALAELRFAVLDVVALGDQVEFRGDLLAQLLLFVGEGDGARPLDGVLACCVG